MKKILMLALVMAAAAVLWAGWGDAPSSTNSGYYVYLPGGSGSSVPMGTGAVAITQLPTTVLTNVTAGAGIAVTGSGRTRAIAATGTLANHAHTNSTDRKFGYEAAWGSLGTSSSSNHYFGRKAGTLSTAQSTTFLGLWSGQSFTGLNSTVVGEQAAWSAYGIESEYLGKYAGRSSAGSNNVFVGYSAGYRAKGKESSYFGRNAGLDSSGNFNTYVGRNAGNGAIGNANTYLGELSGNQSTSHSNMFMGWSAGYGSRSTNSTYIGRYAGAQGSGVGWLYIDSYTNNPYGTHVATNDSIVIDPQGRLHLGRPSGTVYLRATNWIGAPWLDTGGGAMSGALSMGDQAVTDTKYIDIKASVPIGNPASGYARLYADTVNSQEALYYKQSDGSSFRICRDLIHTARNADTVTLTNGVAVYWWTNMTTTAHWMKRAKANDSATMPCQGIVVGGNIATGSTGTVMWQGRCSTGYVSTAAAYGTPLYVSDTTAGALVTTPPLSPSYRQQVGFVNFNGAVDVRLGEQQIPTAAGSSFRSFQMWSGSNSTVMTGAKALRTLDFGNPPSPNMNSVLTITNNQYISYCTLPVGLTQIAAGLYQVNATIYQLGSAPDTLSLSVEIYKRSAAGVFTELTAVAGTAAQAIGFTALEYIYTLNLTSNTTMLATDSIVLRFKASNVSHGPKVAIGAGFLQVPVPSSQYVTTAAPTLTGNLNLGGNQITNYPALVCTWKGTFAQTIPIVPATECQYNPWTADGSGVAFTRITGLGNLSRLQYSEGSTAVGRGLTNCSFDNLVFNLGPITFGAAVGITNLSFPELVLVGVDGANQFAPTTMTALKHLRLPKLKYIGGTFAPTTMAALTNLTLTALESCNNFSPSAMATLQRVYAPALKYASGVVNINTMAALTDVRMPSLIYCGASYTVNPAGGNLVTNITLGATRVTKCIGGNVTATGQKLTQTSVNQILEVLYWLDGQSNTVIYGTGKTINLSGGTSASTNATSRPWCLGLRARGATVTIN